MSDYLHQSLEELRCHGHAAQLQIALALVVRVSEEELHDRFVRHRESLIRPWLNRTIVEGVLEREALHSQSAAAQQKGVAHEIVGSEAGGEWIGRHADGHECTTVGRRCKY